MASSLAAAAAGWLVSPLLESLSERARSCADDLLRYLPPGSASADLQRLSDHLARLLAYASAVERARRRPAHPTLLAWLNRLQDAAHDADDLLDEIHYQRLADALIGPRPDLCSILDTSRALCSRLVCSNQTLNLLLSVLDKLATASADYAGIVPLVELDAADSTQRGNRLARNSSSIIPADDAFFGRVRELAVLIERLVGCNGSARIGNQSIPVIAIVGDGGIGKTKLAQVVFNHVIIQEHFDLLMWVCASSHVDDVKLTREILQAATDWKVDYDWIVNFDRLQKLLVSAVAGRRFLLVLDDVWADKERSMWKNVERWRKLLAPLQNGKQESRIIVTTRMKMVADMLGVRIPMMLGGLGTKEYWSLRKKCALGSENSHEYLHLQEIGRKIALKLKGSKAYMNNFILQEVEQSDVRLIVGSRWIRKCQNRIKAYMNNYLSVSWGPVRSNLETAKSMSPSKRLRTNILIFLSASPPPLQNFVWSFSATCNAQMCWKVPSPVLRDELCVKILEFVIPAYHAHLESLKRSVRGTAEDFELELKSKISELFEG